MLSGLIAYTLKINFVQWNFTSLVYIPEKAMAPHSSTLAWKIPWMEEPGRLQSLGLLELDTTELIKRLRL